VEGGNASGNVRVPARAFTWADAWLEPYTADDCPVGAAPATTPAKPPPPPRPTHPTTSRADAESVARNAANTYTTTRYSIGSGAKDWSANCQAAGEDWACKVDFNQHECIGSVVVGGQAENASGPDWLFRVVSLVFTRGQVRGPGHQRGPSGPRLLRRVPRPQRDTGWPRRGRP
jgi:hypothetical protein